MALITVFTPTYNREETIGRVYSSLLDQRSQDFLWLIIDDGSTDNTEKLVSEWIQEDKLKIKYIKQENMGKTKSINKSFEHVETPLWVCLDSDDYFIDTAIERISSRYDEIKNDEKICGMIGLRTDSEGNSMQNKEIPEDLNYTTQIHLRYGLNIEPEYAQIYKTSIVKEYLYPEIPGENYFPLSYVADQLDQKYELLVIREPLMVIDYQEDGITKNNLKHVVNNPIGQTIFRHQQVRLIPYAFDKIKAAIAYNSGSILAKKRYPFKKMGNKFLVGVTYPLGIIDYIVRLKKGL